jgi:anaerobic selenocysteine-containing dehydrogenase
MVETKKLFCRFCHGCCGIEVDVDTEKNRVIAIRGDRDNPVSGGYTCMKGRAEIERIYHPDRLLFPKKRIEGLLHDIDAEKALDEIADKLRAIIDQYGPRSVAVYAGCPAHRMSTCGPKFLRKWLDTLGSPSLYTSYTVDSPSLSVAVQRFWGAVMPFSLFDMENAEVAMLVGTNPVVSHLFNIPQTNPFKRMRDAKRRGMKSIVVDPRISEVAREADIHLQVKPGEDATLLAAMIKVILDEGIYDKQYVADYGSGLEQLHAAVHNFGIDYAARRTQVPGELILEAARMFATASSGAAVSGLGIHMARHQNLTTQLVITLNGLCGRYDRLGGMVQMPGVLTRYIPDDPKPIPLPLFPGPASRIRGIMAITNHQGLTEMPSNCLTDEILTPGEGQVRALIVHGGQPALVFPDEKDTIRALKSLDLLVVNDLFESATARYADYIFPLKHPFEQADIPAMMSNFYPFPFMQYTPPIVEAPDGVLQGFEVFWGLSKRLGIGMNIPGISLDRKPTADEMLDGLYAGSRVSMNEIRKYTGGHIWGEATPRVGHIIPNMIGNPDKRMALAHPEVLEELKEVLSEPLMETGGYDDEENFAFRMITYRMKEVYCSQGQNLPSLRKRAPYNPVLMNPEDLQSLGLDDGDMVTVENNFGSLVGIVAPMKEMKRGVVGIAHGWGDPGDNRGVRDKGSNVQRLIPDDYRYDPVTGLSLMTAVPVNVIPLEK